MGFFAQLPTLVYTAVLGPDSTSPPDFARLAFYALLFVVLVILSRGAACASPRRLALEVETVANPRRRLDRAEQARDDRRVATRI